MERLYYVCIGRYQALLEVFIEMITDALLDILLFLPNLLLDGLDVLSLVIPEGVFDGLAKIFAFIGWFPIKQLLPILVMSISVATFKITWALLIRIKSFIPTMGD